MHHSFFTIVRLKHCQVGKIDRQVKHNKRSTQGFGRGKTVGQFWHPAGVWVQVTRDTVGELNGFLKTIESGLDARLKKI